MNLLKRKFLGQERNIIVIQIQIKENMAISVLSNLNQKYHLAHHGIVCTGVVGMRNYPLKASLQTS
jgi:hypothetical protein